MTLRSERVNTQAVLRGYPGAANYTSPAQRMEERERVIAYWPEDLIKPITTGTMTAPPWRMLLDPTAWKDVPPAEVHDYVRTWLRTSARWPSLDALRRHYGRVSNHRGPDEVEAQESLL